LIWVAKRSRTPVFLKMHGSLDEMFGKVSAPLKWLRDSMIRNADCIGVLSEVEMSKYLNAWSFLGKRVRVVKNIIKPAFYAVQRRDSEDPEVLFISRFIRQKGMFDLLNAVPGVLRKFPTARFVFIGSGSDADQFDAQVKEAKLARSIRRIDHLNNAETARFYESAWALVFPTYFPEGMPMVVAEAMAAGVPIITTRTNFSRSYMSADDHCLFVDRGNFKSIEEQIVHLMGDHQLRRRMSANNRELAQCFQSEVVAREFLEIYENLQRA
jgi:glycosyltransferase involved in cell wall biosynthesis